MPNQLPLLNEEHSPYSVSTDQDERAAAVEHLRAKLADPAFRAIEGFPIGEDEAILALSDPPHYTACPNPFLPEIVALWQEERRDIRAGLGLPKDAANGYSREPFAADVSEGKNDPIYNAHSYHTKVPHKAIMRYILHYTDPGDIVFDGFCGTGMTGVAAQLCGDKRAVESLGYRVDADGVIYDGQTPISRLGARKAVLVDLSPAATFIAYNYNTPVDVAAFEAEAKRILAEVEAECGWMYETWHPHCDHPQRVKAKINYTVWSDMFVCPNCAGEIVFWEVAVNKVTGEVSDTFPCPKCGAEQSKRTLEHSQVSIFDETQGKIVSRARQIPVLINYTVGKSRHEKLPDSDDLNKIQVIEERSVPTWYPTTRIDRDIDLWYERDYRSLGIYSVDAFFSKRNLWLMAALWEKASSVSHARVADALKFALTGMQVNLSRMNRWRANVSFPYNPLSGTLYVSALQSEANVILGVQNKVKRLSAIWSSPGQSPVTNVTISTQATSGSQIKVGDDSVEYVFIDPPFGSNIIYSDLSMIWEAWLRTFTQPAAEAVVHRRKKIAATTLDDYRRMMCAAFLETYRILKPGRWMTVEFHNTQNAVWNAIQEAILRAGFMIADVRTLDKQMGSFKQVTTTAAVKQDLVISAYKPTSTFERCFQTQAGSESGAWAFADEHLRHLPLPQLVNGRLEVLAERQAYLLFDRMVAFHIQRGLTVPLGAAEFYAGLRQRYSERDGMYFLPLQASQYDKLRLEAAEVEQLSLIVADERSAILWLRRELSEQPLTYQDLQPRFLRELHQAGHEQLPELRALLEESFLQDEAGRWFVPDPGRAQDLERLRERALLREFRTYVEGRGRLKVFRSEAVRAGFGDAWRRRDYAVIVAVAQRLPERVVQEDADLLMYYDNALMRMEGN